MRVCCLSDLHGHLPDVPPCDLLIVAGDVCPTTDHSPNYQAEWLDIEFRAWLEAVPAKKVCGVAGNHDLIFQYLPGWVPPLLWFYLEDFSLVWNGLRIYGSPWQPTFGIGWAFNLDEPDLARKWAAIPDDTDILVLHGPPYGYGDWSNYSNVHTGSPSLLKRIEEVKPKLVVAGHIHEGYGRYQIGETIFVNASHVNERYEPVNKPIVVEL